MLIDPTATTLIRSVQLEDADQIASLSDLLGYSITAQQAHQRLTQLQQNQNHAIYVAQVPHRVIGWIHVFVEETLVVGKDARIAGLIVHPDARDRGVGRLLMQAAEQWARSQGCERVVVSSNTVRQAAHRFYENVGYVPLKTQLVLFKTL